jgi:hypothetical protein
MNAENERIKLRATFYNNLAVGSAVAGLLVPYIALWPRFFSAQATTLDGLLELIKPDALLGMIVAALLTLFFRLRADRWINSLEDED